MSLRAQASLLLLLLPLGCAAPSARVVETDVADAGVPARGSGDAGAPDAGDADTEGLATGEAPCEQGLSVIQRSLKAGRLAEAVVLARQRESRCPGGELLSAQLLVFQGRFDDAADPLLHQALSPSASPAAFEQLVRLFPRFSPRVQEQVTGLGASLPAAIPVLSIREANAWVTQVVCRGNRLDRLDDHDLHAPGRGSYRFECPPGVAHRVFFKFQKETGPNLSSQPAGMGLAVEQLLPALGSRYGIYSVAQLRAAVDGPRPLDRSSAWLIDWLKDYPGQLSLWKELLRKDPDDLEAAFSLSQLQYRFGDFKGALKTLDAVPLDTVSVRDTRGGVRSTGALFTVRCQILLSQHKMKQAEAACRTAIERGAKINGPYYLALLLYLQGRDEEALRNIELSLAGRRDNPPAHFLQFLLLQSLGRQREAVVAATGATDSELMDDRVRNGQRSREAWGVSIEQQEKKQLAEELARCGHYYLDLELPEQARACFSRAEALGPEAVVIERLLHQAESDPPAAIQAAQALLDKERTPIRMYAMAFAQQRAGNPTEALRWLDESLGMGLRPSTAHRLVIRACQDLNQKDCLKKHGHDY